MKADDPLGTRKLADTQKLLSKYMDWLESEIPSERVRGVQALEGLGNVALPALGAIEKLLSDPDARVRKAAAHALVQIASCFPGQ